MNPRGRLSDNLFSVSKKTLDAATVAVLGRESVLNTYPQVLILVDLGPDFCDYSQRKSFYAPAIRAANEFKHGSYC